MSLKFSYYNRDIPSLFFLKKKVKEEGLINNRTPEKRTRRCEKFNGVRRGVDFLFKINPKVASASVDIFRFIGYFTLDLGLFF
jgi:hypothetical protein